MVPIMWKFPTSRLEVDVFWRISKMGRAGKNGGQHRKCQEAAGKQGGRPRGSAETDFCREGTGGRT